MTETASDDRFKPEYRIAWLSALGFIGLLLGFIFLSYDNLFVRNKPASPVFHEIAYRPRDLVCHAIDGLSDSLGKKIDTFHRLVKSYKQGQDSFAILNTLIKTDTQAIITLQQDKQTYEAASDRDTVSRTRLNSLIHLNVSPIDIDRWEAAFEKEPGYGWKADVKYWVRMTNVTPVLTWSGQTTLRIDSTLNNMQFFAKYPQSATWIYLIAVFCSFCLVAISTSIETANDIFAFLGSQKKGRFKQWPFYIIWGIILLALGLLQLLLRNSFNDELPEKSLFLMKHLRPSLVMVNVLGYITGACCLAGFVYTASMLGFFEQSKQDNSKALAQQNIVAEERVTLTTEKQSLEQSYDRLLGFFNKYFTLSAIVLSLSVLCTGSLLGTMNSIDFFQALVSNWGYTPARGDIVYLYGGVFTVILLLIYLPARIRFNEIKLQLPPDPGKEGAPDQKGQGANWFDFFKDPFSLLKGTLLAASPLLASIVQSLFDLLFKH
jgi:hypothetical protein